MKGIKAVLPVIALILTLLPSMAAAMDFTFYTLANGAAIYDIVTSASMMMMSEGFKTMITAAALLGLLVMGGRAIGDPGRHLPQVFGYAVLVAMGARAATSMTVPLWIHDVNGTMAAPQLYKVDRVPIIMAVPVSLVTAMGHRSTELIESFFGTGPSTVAYSNDAKISKGAAFNLMGRFLEDGNKIMFSNPSLRMTINGYIADCVIPSVALGYTSFDSLMKSSSLITVLGESKSNALLTKDYSTPGAVGGTSVKAGAAIQTCTTAYDKIKSLTDAEATAILNAPAATGFKSGAVAAPMNAYITSGIGLMGLSDTANGGYDGKSYISQKAMMNTMSGAFKNAAVQTGNNEMLTAISIEQAEQAQKSTWFSARVLFENMMPYLYVIIQAFTLAVIPLCLIMLFVPGFGFKIGINLIQITLWLALWEPMFAILNYLLILFGADNLGTPIAAHQGLTMANAGLLTEQSNMLILAGGFFGTLLPAFAWGIVSGGMAFTQFIASGVNAGGATQAGSSASSGNLSMGNLSMNSTSANKFDTMAMSSVGTGAVMSQVGSPGAGLGTWNQGGSQGQANGANTNQTTQTTAGLSAAKAYQKATSAEHMASHQDQSQAAEALVAQQVRALSANESVAWKDDTGVTNTLTKNADGSFTIKDSTGYAAKGSISEDGTRAKIVSNNISAKGSVGLDTPFGGGKVEAGVDLKNQKQVTNKDSATAEKSRATGEDQAYTEKNGKGLSFANSLARSVTSGTGLQYTDSKGHSTTNSHSNTAAVSDAAKRLESITDTYTTSYQQNSSETVTHGHGTHLAEVEAAKQAVGNVAGNIAAGGGSVERQMAATEQKVDKFQAATNAAAATPVTNDVNVAKTAGAAEAGIVAGGNEARAGQVTMADTKSAVNSGARQQEQWFDAVNNTSTRNSDNLATSGEIPLGEGLSGGTGNAGLIGKDHTPHNR